MKIRILTDTSCGIKRYEADEIGFSMLPLPFMMDEKEYDDDSITKSEFYKKLYLAKTVSTSQASVDNVLNAFDSILDEYDHIIYLPITSGLSSAYASAVPLISDDKYKGKITIIDHKTISVLQRGLIYDIKRLIEKNVSPDRIKELVEYNAKYNRIYIAVDTLDFLKKGGRISALSAAVGSILNIKPILFSNGGKFEVIKKARGIKAAGEEIKNLIVNDLKGMFSGLPMEDLFIGVAYTDCEDEASKFRESLKEILNTDVVIDELPSIVGCHIGIGAVAAAIYKHINEG